MPNLFIRYGDLVLHDDNVDVLEFSDAPGAVSVTGKLSPPKTAGGGAGVGGLLEMFTGARKNQTAATVEAKRAELQLEKAAEAEEAS